jgi:hypothetical protein
MEIETIITDKGAFNKSHINEGGKKMDSFRSTMDEGDELILQKMQYEMDVLFGRPQPSGTEKRFRTLYDLYKHYTGDDSASGVFNPVRLSPELRSSMAINSATFPNVLANTLNRFLSTGYNKINFFEQILISQKSPATHFHEGTFVELGCWADLPDIDPETEDYLDMPNITEAVNPFDLLQKGCVIPISRRVIINDDIEFLQRLMLKLGLVGRKTHARYVWNKWINNEDCNDGTAWFTSGHNNLGSAAISISEVTAAITALAVMVEPGPSTDVLGIDLTKGQFHLVIAPSAWDDGVKVNQTQYTYSSNDLTSQATNPCYRLFGEKNERIATPPFLTGADWGIVRDCEEVPIIEMQYLEGNQEPKIFFQKDPQADRAIMGDWFGLKCLHEYAGSVSDYRGAYKSVAP